MPSVRAGGAGDTRQISLGVGAPDRAAERLVDANGALEVADRVVSAAEDGRQAASGLEAVLGGKRPSF